MGYISWLITMTGKYELYEKPFIEPQDGLVFPTQIMDSFNGGRFCVQCSGCHGCR